MAKKGKRARALSTNESLELLLGKKAAKRLRKLAMRVAKDKEKGKKKEKDKDKNEAKEKAKANAAKAKKSPLKK